MQERYANLSQESAESYLSIKPSKSWLQKVVENHIESQGELGATDEEIQEATGMAQNTERPRRGELVAQGIIVKSDKKRKTKSGRTAAVWVHRKFIIGNDIQTLLF